MGSLPPVTDGNADDVEASTLDLPEVVERDKVLPVRFQYIGAAVLAAQLLAKRPLVVDRPVCRVVFLEDRRCNEPSFVSWSKQQKHVEATHGSSTSQPPRFTPRTVSLPQLKLTLRSRRVLQV